MMVSFNLNGMIILPALMELTHQLEILQASSSSTAPIVTIAEIVGSSSLSPGGTEPPPKKACFGALLRVSSQYVRGASYPSHGFFSSYLRF
jgi:hypothetical protein